MDVLGGGGGGVFGFGTRGSKKGAGKRYRTTESVKYREVGRGKGDMEPIHFTTGISLSQKLLLLSVKQGIRGKLARGVGRGGGGRGVFSVGAASFNLKDQGCTRRECTKSVQNIMADAYRLEGTIYHTYISPPGKCIPT
jgi:hypothetical protein